MGGKKFSDVVGIIIVCLILVLMGAGVFKLILVMFS